MLASSMAKESHAANLEFVLHNIEDEKPDLVCSRKYKNEMVLNPSLVTAYWLSSFTFCCYAPEKVA